MRKKIENGIKCIFIIEIIFIVLLIRNSVNNSGIFVPLGFSVLFVFVASFFNIYFLIRMKQSIVGICTLNNKDIFLKIYILFLLIYSPIIIFDSIICFYYNVLCLPIPMFIYQILNMYCLNRKYINKKYIQYLFAAIVICQTVIFLFYGRNMFKGK